MVSETISHFFSMLSHNAFVIAVFVFIISVVLARVFDTFVVKKVRSKKKRSNLGIFVHALKYGMIVILVVYIFRSYARVDTDYSVVIGLISASLGFALQKPITSAAGWLIIVLKKPFYIGDRIIIGKVKGDVVDITLSHIVLLEVGGTVSSEDQSGRIIHIPTLILFEENIINYTLTDEYILDEITVLITYESNLEKAEYIIQKSANQVLAEFNEIHKRPPYIRLFFDSSGVNIKVRYFVAASKRHEISSDIIRLIHGRFLKESNVEIAYPHMQIVRRALAKKSNPSRKMKKGSSSFS